MRTSNCNLIQEITHADNNDKNTNTAYLRLHYYPQSQPTISIQQLSKISFLSPNPHPLFFIIHSQHPHLHFLCLPTLAVYQSAQCTCAWRNEGRQTREERERSKGESRINKVKERENRERGKEEKVGDFHSLFEEMKCPCSLTLNSM